MQADKDTRRRKPTPKPQEQASASAQGAATPVWASGPGIRVGPRRGPTEKAAENAEAGHAAPQCTGAAPAGRSPLASDAGSAVPAALERAAGVEGSGARVHQGPEDREFAGLLGARAATHGRDIFLAEGESVDDSALMRHELAHVAEGGDVVRLRAATFLERRMWKGFFDHYLPRKFLDNYMDDTGKALTLTLQEMIDCNPIVDLRRSTVFMAEVAKLAAAGGGTKSIVAKGWGGARTNGTLGNFTITYTGTVSVKADGSWTFVGTMTFYDYWDFDPKGKNSGRSEAGEQKVRVAAALLPGRPFHVYSESAAVSQTSSDDRGLWGSMKAPVSVGDKKDRGVADIAAGDVAGGPVGGDVGTQSSEDLNK